jgi:acyl-CoA thioester hydrolase
MENLHKHAHAKVEWIEIPVRVRYADTDRMGIIYYGTYPVYFEIARTEFMRKKGFTYRELEEAGYHLVVVGMDLKYYNSATYDDLLIVKTSIPNWQSRGMTFHYEIYKDKSLIVEGHTKHICVTSNRKPIVIPPLLLAILKDVSPK